MTKIGRNDPCPCGSGKKYKHCCLAEENRESRKSLAQQIREEMEEKLCDRRFESLEEANDFIARITERKNLVSQIDFLGLSSEQVHRMLHSPLDTLEDMVRFNHGLKPEAFREIPVVKNTLLFLTSLRQVEPLKATAKGNLPLAFARELHDEFIDPAQRFRARIRSEEEALLVNSLRHLLTMCGWLKKAKKHYSLTLKGTRLIEQGFSEPHFFELMNVFVRRFNWGFQDRYPPFWIIQGGAVFSLYLLHRKARQVIPSKELSDFFVRAFPAVLDEVEVNIPSLPAEEIQSCFSLRFLERFCQYFGLADIHRQKKGLYQFDLSVKKSDFYDLYINWLGVS